MALYVTAVDENSPAERLGISVGCALLAIDGHPLNDALDYQFYTTPAQFSLALCEHEQHRTVQVEKGEYEPLGCNFKTYLGDEKHSCSNHCMFCFIDQLPHPFYPGGDRGPDGGDEPPLPPGYGSARDHPLPHRHDADLR